LSDLNLLISPIDNVDSSGIGVLAILASGLSDADALRVKVADARRVEVADARRVEVTDALRVEVADALRKEVKSKETESTEDLLEVESGFFLIRFGMPPWGIVIPVIYVLPPFPLMVVLPLNDTGTSLKAILLLILTNFGRK
jgi:hypothetical protein